MGRRAIKIAYAAVDGGDDYRERALDDVKGRIDDLVATTKALGETAPDLLMFPAGYFQVRDMRGRAALAGKISRSLDELRPKFDIVVGVDVGAIGKIKTKTRKSASSGAHPYFVLHQRASGAQLWLQQVSVTAEEGRDRDVVEGRWGTRDVLLAGTDIALLICGESLSDVLVADELAPSGARALAVAAHRTVSMHGKNTGWETISWHLRLDAHAKTLGMPIVLSEHTRSPSRHAYCWPDSTAKRLEIDAVPKAVTLRLAIVG